MTEERRTALARLLTEAEAAHGTYEAAELGGEYDADWATWYARHMVDHGIGSILGHDLSVERLGELLAEGYAGFARLEPPPAEGWAPYLAARIASEL
jgi:hypothetical protein